MAKHSMEFVLAWAKVFEENLDLGDPKSSEKWLRELAKNGGQASVNCYFKSEDQVEELLAQGFQQTTLNPRTGKEINRIKSGDAELGIGQYVVLTRKMNNVKEWPDSKTGNMVTMDFGGVPVVIDMTNGKENRKKWDFAKQGPLGNGTEALVQYDLYNGNLRLEAIAVTKHVVYEETASEEDEIFMVA